VAETLTLPNVLDDAALFSFEHQLHLAEVLGDHSWSVDMTEQRFEFTGSRPLSCSRFHLLGSAAPGPRSWLWGWANPAGYPEALSALSASLRDFGQQHGITELASPEVPFDALPGSPTEPAAVVGLLTDAAKAVSGQWTSYNGEVGGGTRAAFLIQQAIAELQLTDHRRALHSYALRRQLGAEFSPDYAKLTIKGPGFEAVASFDEFNRVAGIRASMSPPS
jgi:hypothetical protein